MCSLLGIERGDRESGDRERSTCMCSFLGRKKREMTERGRPVGPLS